VGSPALVLGIAIGSLLGAVRQEVIGDARMEDGVPHMNLLCEYAYNTTAETHLGTSSFI
jgi:hypothetical protein